MTDDAKLHVDAAFGGVEWLHARYTNHTFDMHAHHEYVIAIVDEGAEVFRCGRQTHVAPAGAIYTINPDEPHDGRAQGAVWCYRALYPSVGFVQRALGDAAPRSFAQTVWRDAESWRLLSAMHALFTAPSCGVARQSAVVAALSRVFAVNGAAPAPEVRSSGAGRGVARVKDVLRERFSDPHTLETLGAEAGLHPNYLLATFKQRYGVTPAVFLRTERLTQAKAMIRAGRSLKAVAQDAGFFDQAHLSRCFKRAFGATPSAYAAACAHSGRQPLARPGVRLSDES